ncbi:MAG: hypothetical protein JSV25_08180 [Spirochaetota bacterium]|nr:MAG: hypothetical protein JSV25_08180 [Spirochaetota bacterium]
MEEQMEDSVERVEEIFGELGYDIFEREITEEMYQASFGRDSEVTGSIFMENDCNFMEIAYTYVFDREEENFLKEHLESMMNICYEYGIYFNIMREEDEINFSIFSKLYFSGLNVESLQDTIGDFISCNSELVSMFNVEENDSFSEGRFYNE